MNGMLVSFNEIHLAHCRPIQERTIILFFKAGIKLQKIFLDQELIPRNLLILYLPRYIQLGRMKVCFMVQKNGKRLTSPVSPFKGKLFPEG